MKKSMLCCAEDKVRGGEDEGPGHGCLDLGQVLPQWPAAETGTNMDFPVLCCIMLGNDSLFCRKCNHTTLVSTVSSCLCCDFHGDMWLCSIHALYDSDYSCFNYLAYFFLLLQIVYYEVERLFILQLYCLLSFFR